MSNEFLSAVIVIAVLAVLDLGLTMMSLKLYTEIMKEKAQRERKP